MFHEDAEEVDVLIAGAGPSGSAAARSLSASGIKVLMLERKMEIGSPVMCGDAVNAYLEEIEVLRDDPRIFIKPLESLKVTGPSRKSSFQMFPSFDREDSFNSIVERDRLDKELASLALIDGARLHIRSELVEYGEIEGGISATYKRGGKTRKIGAKFLLIATGAVGMTENSRSSGVKPFNYVYKRGIGTGKKGSEMDINQGGSLEYSFSRFTNEHNTLKIGLSNKVNETSMGNEGNDILAGSVEVGLPVSMHLGSSRIFHMGSNAGLYDPLFLTGFREAYLSGMLAAASIVESGGNAGKSFELYSEKIKSNLAPGMEAGHELSIHLSKATKGKIDDFVEYLSTFEFKEVSAREIFKKTNLKGSELQEMLS